MATIGRNQAVVEFPNGLRFHGFIGWLMWLGLHLIELMGFRNRANVFVNWAWNYLTYDRASRLLLDPPASPPTRPGGRPATRNIHTRPESTTRERAMSRTRARSKLRDRTTTHFGGMRMPPSTRMVSAFM